MLTASAIRFWEKSQFLIYINYQVYQVTLLFFFNYCYKNLTLVMLTQIYPAFTNSVDPDQLASEEANWSGYALFAIKYENLYPKPGLSNLIGWKKWVGILIYSVWQGLTAKLFCLCWGFTSQSTQWGHVECGKFTWPHFYWADLVL